MARTARPVLVLWGIASAMLLLSGCGGPAAPAASVSTSASAVPSPTATATTNAVPSASPAPPSNASFAAKIPGSCDQLATPATHEATVGGMRLQSEGEGFVRPAPVGASLVRGCDWIVGDTTGVLVLISTASPDAVTAGVAALPGQGYSCQASDDFGAQYCVKPGQGENTEDTIVARDDVWLYLASSNVNARGFLSEIASQIYG